MIGVTLIVMIFALILLGVPIFAALGATGTMGLIFLQSRSALGGISWITIPQSIYSGIASFPLLAIPFFIFAGEIMNRGKITEKLIKFALMLIGRMPASLAQANIVASMFFGGVTGSAQADTSAIGGMLIPAMIKEGYSKETAVAVTASSSTVGPIIPPSIMMVIYGVCVGTSVGAMFLGGFIPGLMVGLGLMTVVALQDRTMHFPRRTEKMTWEEKRQTFADAIWPLGMPIIIVGGILGGVCTPTEAGAVAVVYSMLVSMFVLKTVTVKDIVPMLYKTILQTSTTLMIISAAKIVSYVLTALQIPAMMGAFMASVTSSPYVFMLMVNVLILILGMFMDGGASVIVLAPILAPIAAQFGINDVHFGVVMVLNLIIGCGTPPLGVCLFLACNIAKCPVEKGGKAILPYVLAEVIVLFLITYFPFFETALPGMFGYI